MPPIVFLDLEASGLGPASWPIEVGWCFVSGRPSAVLIRPDESWPDSAWDPAAEALHGLAQKKLERRGAAAAEVCTKVNAALEGADVYSDAPDWDSFWLYRLFSAAKMRQAFQLRDFAELFDHLPPEKFHAAKEAATKKSPHKHRAKDDVLHMRALYKLSGADQDG